MRSITHLEYDWIVRVSFPLLLSMSLVSTACLGQVSGTSGPSSEADAGSDQEVSLFAPPDAGGQDVVPDVTTDHGWVDDTADSDEDTGGCPADDLPLVSEPSVRSAVFEVTNDTEVDQFLVIEGFFCDPFSVGGFTQRIGFQCICECPNPGSPYASRYVRLGPGQTHTFNWDGRQLRTYVWYQDCALYGWQGAGCASVLEGARFPVDAGEYLLELLVTDALPDSDFECTEFDDGEIVCTDYYTGFGGDGLMSPYQSICPNVDRLSGSFDLPENGQVVAEFRLSELQNSP